MITLSALLLIGLGVTSAPSSAPLPETALGIVVDPEHWQHPKQGGLISPLAAYAPNRGKPGYGDLVEMASLAVGGDTFDAVWVRRSADNGKTWQPASELCILDRSVVEERDRKRLRILADSLFADETSGMMVLFVNYYSPAAQADAEDVHREVRGAHRTVRSASRRMTSWPSLRSRIRKNSDQRGTSAQVPEVSATSATARS